MSDSDCVFCKMVAGEIPVTRIYEDDNVLAFLDIAPISDGHTLVIPKIHCETIHQTDPEVLARLAERLPNLAAAVMQAVEADGYNVLCNAGKAAGQVVQHVHFHIIPRKTNDGVFDRWPSYEYPQGKAAQLAQKIRENL